MAEIPKDTGSGGRVLWLGSKPTDLKTILFEVSEDLDAIAGTSQGAANAGRDGVVYQGGLVTDPTTPSTQATGAAGITVWRVDVSAAEAQVNSVDDLVAASADEVIHDTNNLLDAVGKACYAAVVLAESGGSISITSVEGTPDVVASVEMPTAAEIDTGVGHQNWAYLAMCYLERTADTTVVQSQVNAGYGKPAPAGVLKTSRET
jgi:hypothetical protein